MAFLNFKTKEEFMTIVYSVNDTVRLTNLKMLILKSVLLNHLVLKKFKAVTVLIMRLLLMGLPIVLLMKIQIPQFIFHLAIQ